MPLASRRCVDEIGGLLVALLRLGRRPRWNDIAAIELGQRGGVGALRPSDADAQVERGTRVVDHGVDLVAPRGRRPGRGRAAR